MNIEGVQYMQLMHSDVVHERLEWETSTLAYSRKTAAGLDSRNADCKTTTACHNLESPTGKGHETCHVS